KTELPFDRNKIAKHPNNYPQLSQPPGSCRSSITTSSSDLAPLTLLQYAPNSGDPNANQPQPPRSRIRDRATRRTASTRKPRPGPTRARNRRRTTRPTKSASQIRIGKISRAQNSSQPTQNLNPARPFEPH